ncbi:MAG: hypothetical protein Q4G65_00530 [bacterium]|nr:hypothetical protein [bacterium]
MNKALHALVYVTLVVAAAALFFEIQLDGKRELLKDRNRQLEDYIVKISNTIEKSDAAKPASLPEARKDVSAVEAKLVDSPETENVLEDYPAQLEEANLETLKWDDKERIQLRQLYKLDGEGNKIPDAANPGDFVKKGAGTAQELLDQLFERAKAQQAKLNTTRAELANARTKLEALVNDYNKLKPEGRQDKVTIEEKKAQIEELEQAKAAVEEQLTKTKSQIDDLNAEIKSLKDERDSAKDETEAVKEDLAKTQKLVDQLKKLLQNQPAQQQTVASGTVNAAPLTVGNKGKIVEVNSKLMFAVIEFDEDAMKELLGPERQNALPQLEMGIRRTGFQGPAGEYVGRLRLRQSVPGKNFVIADLLGDWLQTEVKKGDVIFAE